MFNGNMALMYLQIWYCKDCANALDPVVIFISLLI